MIFPIRSEGHLTVQNIYTAKRHANSTTHEFGSKKKKVRHMKQIHILSVKSMKKSCSRVFFLKTRGRENVFFLLILMVRILCQLISWSHSSEYLMKLYSNQSKHIYFKQKTVNIETSKLIGLKMRINLNLTGVQM